MAGANSSPFAQWGVVLPASVIHAIAISVVRGDGAKWSVRHHRRSRRMPTAPTRSPIDAQARYDDHERGTDSDERSVRQSANNRNSERRRTHRRPAPEMPG